MAAKSTRNHSDHAASEYRVSPRASFALCTRVGVAGSRKKIIDVGWAAGYTPV